MSTDFDGTERKPMRIAEARVTHGVIAAREGDPQRAVAQGEQALTGDRQSLPSLLMVSRELATLVKNRYPASDAGRSYLSHLRDLAQPASA